MNPSPDPARGENGPARVRALLEQAVLLAESDQPAAGFFNQFLPLVRGAVDAVGAAAWQRTGDGGIQAASQSGLEEILATLTPEALEGHAQFLAQTIERGQPVFLAPQNNGNGSNGPPPNPILLAPLAVDGKVVGLLETWMPPDTSRPQLQNSLRLVIELAGLASRFLRGSEKREAVDRQRLWEQLEAFDLAIHASLNPTEVAFVVANDGRKLVGGDRLTVVVRSGRRARVEAVSGTDVIERRANPLRRLAALCDRVMDKGERLVFDGTRQDDLPPDVLEALDAYLAEGTPTFLIVEPLQDRRDKTLKNTPRSALVLECFGSPGIAESLVGRLEVVGRHAASALYNAVEYRQIPLRPLWLPIARLQKGLGGKTRAITICSVVAVALITAALLWVPYPLKMEAKGQLLPEERSWIYSPVEAQVLDFAPGIKPGAEVAEGQSLVLMHDLQLQLKVVQIQSEITGAQHDVETLTAQFNVAATESDRQSIAGERRKKEYLRDRKLKELTALRERTHAVDGRPGHFWLKSSMAGTILNGDFREALVNRQVKPSDPILRIGDKTKPWEVELKIPHKHMGQVLLAFDDRPDAELDVDILLTSHPTKTFKGKLAKSKVGGEATPNKDDPADAEPVLTAWVRIDGPDIAEEDKIPADLLLSGTEVHAKVRCGDRRLGYALFYGVGEFIYEKLAAWF